jgi:hypothetical protein
MSITVLSLLLGAFLLIVQPELRNYYGSAKAQWGFLAAEGALNVRASEIRQIMVGYNVPAGSSPTNSAPCEGSNLGSGDFQCRDFQLNNRSVKTYVQEAAGNPILRSIPADELYGGLTAQEYRYTARAEALDSQGRTEALLDLNFMSRLVPLFQFVAFYDKDLEILPGPNMNLNGPVHSNQDLYLNSDNTLSINGQVSVRGTLYRGRKNTDAASGTVRVHDTASFRTISRTGSRRTVTSAEAPPFNGRLRLGVDELVVPEPEMLDPTPGAVYWDKADLRLVLRLNAAGAPITSASNPTNSTGVWVYAADGTIDVTMTTNLNTCSVSGGELSGNRAVANSISFYNNRENSSIRMLEVDLRRLFRCIHTGNLFGAGKTLNDQSEGGIVIHLSVNGPLSGAATNNYGIRVRNAATLRSSTSTDPLPRGVTLVSDQAFYTYGHFNSSNWIPASILADSINILSRNWNDAGASAASGCPASGNRCATNSGTGTGNVTSTNRNATSTDIYAAFLGGTDTTGNQEGSAGQGGAYNGGLENYPRLHENWTNITLTYVGSFVSLRRPRHVAGAWIYGSRYYEAPNRNWDYDVRFNDAANLPPLSPRFVYLRQELFSRDYEQN